MDGLHDPLNSGSDIYLQSGLLATNKLASLCGETGRFIYRYDANGESPLPGYNLLRHCGAIWALTVGARHSPNKHEINAVAARALTWLKSNHLRDLPHGYGIVEPDGSVKLGGNALAIIAICSTPLIEDIQWADVCKGLGAHILRSNQRNGTFISKIDASTGKPYPVTVHYYNGQALLALVVLWRLTNEEGILNVVTRAMARRAAAAYGVGSQNHWMLLAVELLYAVRPTKTLLRYATRLARQILRDPHYRLRDHSTPIACRTEALLAFCRLALVHDAPLNPADVAVALSAIRTNLNLQLRDALPDGAFIRGAGISEVRIDYLQHNLMSFLAYADVAALLEAHDRIA